MFEGFETSPTRGRKPIGIDTATTQAEPTESGTLKKSVTVGSFFYKETEYGNKLAHPNVWVCKLR